MRLAVRQAEQVSETANSGDNGGENTSGQEEEQQQEQGNGEDGSEQQDGETYTSSSLSDSSSTSQDTSDQDSPSSSSLNQDSALSSSAGDSGSPTANPTGTGSESESEQHSSQGTSTTSDTPQNSTIEEKSSSSSSYTPEPTAISESTSSPDTMDQSSTSDDNNGPSNTSPTEDTPTQQPDSSTTSPTDFTSDTSTTSEPTPTSITETTEEPNTSEATPSLDTISDSTSDSTTDAPFTSSTSTTEEPSPTVSPTQSTSSNFDNVAPSTASTPIITLPSELASASDLLPTSIATSDGDSLTSSTNDQALGSPTSSEDIALGDRLATTASPAVKINGSPSISNGLEPSSTDESGSNDDGNANSGSRDPSLNGAGDGSSSNSKMIGGTVAGIIAAIVIIVFVVWLIGKRRRQKFVKPIVERMHASGGSGYSLPSLLNGSGSRGSGSGGATPGTSSPVHPILTATRRRSRAFSIESASIYNHVDNNPDTIQTVGSGELSQVAPMKAFNGGNQDAVFIPVAAAPFSYRTLDGMGKNPAQGGSGYEAYSGTGYNSTGMIGSISSARMTATKHHQQIPSASSFGSNYMLDRQVPNSAEYENRQYEYNDAYDGLASAVLAFSTSFQRQQASHPERFYQNAQYASPTRELLVPSLVKSDSRHGVGSPFDDEEELHGSLDPMPHSPTMTPTLLQRRTTDPFSDKKALRVVNVDHNRDPGTPTGSSIGEDTPAIATPRPHQSQNEESRPFSNWSSIAPSRASTSTMSDAYSTFHFDSPAVGGSDGNYSGFGNGGRTSRADSLDANRRLRIDHTINYKRASSSLELVVQEADILTPRQVSDVGFFREV